LSVRSTHQIKKKCEKSSAVRLDLIEQKLGILQVDENFTIFIELTLYLIKPEDWFTVSMVEAYEAGLSRHSFQRSVQLVELLQEKYPSLDLQRMSILRGKFGQQRKLEQAVAALFPVHAIS